MQVNNDIDNCSDIDIAVKSNKIAKDKANFIEIL